MLDYTKVKRKTNPVKLPNGQTILLTMPKKKTFEKMAALEDSAEQNNGEAAINEMYEVAAEILSNNIQKKHFTVDEVGKLLNIEEVKMLYTEYANFVNGVKSDPN